MAATLDIDLDQALAQYFAYSEFKPGQREVISHLLAGRSAAAVFPTGGGKSLCYQLPSLLLPGLTLVVSPLIALMKDQIDALLTRDIVAARLDSSLTADCRERPRRGFTSTWTPPRKSCPPTATASSPRWTIWVINSCSRSAPAACG